MKIPEFKVKVKKVNNVKASELFKISSSEDSYKALREIYNADTFEWREEVILLCLNRANKLIGYYKVSTGGMTGAILDPKIIYTIALNSTATSIIISHNHPSGNLTPSRADTEVTHKIKEAGKVLDITLLDHIICTTEGYYSYADEGNL